MAEVFNLPTKEQFDTMNSHLANISIPDAAKVTIEDTGSHYTSGNVEGALQEVGESINSLDANKANKTQEAWITPTLLNGWQNYNVDFTKAGYYKDNLGMVHLKGVVAKGTIANVIFILPEGYRPAEQIMIVVATSETEGRAYVYPDGRVSHSLGGNTFLSLDNVSFKAAL